MSQNSDHSAVPAHSWRRTLFAVCIAQATAIVGFDFTLPFIPLFLQHDLGVHGLGQTAIWAGLIGFGPAIPATIFGPLWGRLADRMGYRVMLLRAVICASILLALMAAAPSPGALLVLRMIQGGLTGTVFSAQALVASATPEKETGRAMGLLQMSVSLGATLGPVGGGLIASTLGFRAAFVSAGILLAASAVVVYVFVQEPETRRRRAQSEEQRPSMRSVLMIPAFAGALLLTLAVQLSATALFPIIPLFVQDLMDSSRNVASYTGWVMAVSGLASAAGSYVAGRLQRRIGLHRMLFGSLILSSVLLLPQAFAGSYMAFLGMRAAAGFAFGCLYGLVGAWAALSSPRHAKGTAFGLMGAASSIGFGAGPLLGGILAAAVGIRPVFVVSAVLVGCIPLLSGAVALTLPLVRPTPGRDTRRART